jgi:peptidyl-prolyl cis-trans isomerase B (cyclophilin B)
MIVMELENGDILKIRLYPEYAPVTCENFTDLVGKGHYNGLTFHRVIPGFMIQGGCPLGNGTGGTEPKIKGEFRKNGVDNPLSHKRGVVSMARSADPNSASCQFFIVHKDSPHLDGDYAAFGEVAEGIDAIDRIADTPTDRGDKPAVPVVIRKMYARD